MLGENSNLGKSLFNFEVGGEEVFVVRVANPVRVVAKLNFKKSGLHDMYNSGGGIRAYTRHVC